MRQGSLTRLQGRIAIAATLALLAAISMAASTSGIHVTAGNIEMSMDMKPEQGLSIRFDMPARG